MAPVANLRTRHLPALPLAIASALCLSIAPASPAAAQSGDLPDTARVQLLLRDGQWIEGRIDTLDAASCTVFRADAGVQAKASEIALGTVVACLVNPEQRRSMEFLTQLAGGTLVFSDGQFLPGVLSSLVEV